MREFQYGRALKVLLSIACLVLIAVFGRFLFYYSDGHKALYFFAILPVSLAMIALPVYGIVDLAIGKFVITSDRVVSRSPLGYRTLMLDQIRGFRHDQNYIRILAHSPVEKGIKISTYFKETNQIIEWLYTHYSNLDILEGNEEEHQVLQNDEIGITEEKRL